MLDYEIETTESSEIADNNLGNVLLDLTQKMRLMVDGISGYTSLLFMTESLKPTKDLQTLLNLQRVKESLEKIKDPIEEMNKAAEKLK